VKKHTNYGLFYNLMDQFIQHSVDAKVEQTKAAGILELHCLSLMNFCQVKDVL
jgi:hypothetical protein